MKSELLVARCHFMWERLPTEKCLRVPCTMRKGMSGKGLAYLNFPAVHSEIIATSGKPSELRQEGATVLHVEEFQNWTWAEESWTAMLPTIQGGGKIVVIGTPRPGTHFERLVFDQFNSQHNG